MRLIDADSFDKYLSDAEIEAKRQQKHVFASALNTIRGNLRNFPTIEPERKKGEWVKKMKVTESETCTSYTPEWYCKNCGKKYDPYFANHIVNYCYVCGDDMRGEQNGND